MVLQHPCNGLNNDHGDTVAILTDRQSSARVAKPIDRQRSCARCLKPSADVPRGIGGNDDEHANDH